jgi:hypothetical protein
MRKKQTFAKQQWKARSRAERQVRALAKKYPAATGAITVREYSLIHEVYGRLVTLHSDNPNPIVTSAADASLRKALPERVRAQVVREREEQDLLDEAQIVRKGRQLGTARSVEARRTDERDRLIHDAKVAGKSVSEIADAVAIFPAAKRSGKVTPAFEKKRTNRQKLVSRVLHKPRP